VSAEKFESDADLASHYPSVRGHPCGLAKELESDPDLEVLLLMSL